MQNQKENQKILVNETKSGLMDCVARLNIQKYHDLLFHRMLQSLHTVQQCSYIQCFFFFFFPNKTAFFFPNTRLEQSVFFLNLKFGASP
tara:strand:- start:50 stop:316 length:267 start_codon:yes stop_codon:yes gene_type:complete